MTMKDADPEFHSFMRDATRSTMGDIWQRGNRGAELTGEDLSYYEAMCLHPEYADVWAHAAELGQQDVVIDGVNPFLHISMHSIIENQLRANDPPETAQALFRLTRGGVDRHEALHHIAYVLAELMQECLTSRQLFPLAKYKRRLRELRP
jgi:hypothetical protein